MSKQSQTIPFPLRMPAELRDRLEAEAQENGRSVNAEIIDRLQKSWNPQSNTAGSGAVLNPENVKLIADAVCDAVARRVTQAIPGSLDLWDNKDIASYLKRSVTTVRTDVVVQPSFPKPVRLPGDGQAHALYIAREVIRWAEGLQQPVRARRSPAK